MLVLFQSVLLFDQFPCHLNDLILFRLMFLFDFLKSLRITWSNFERNGNLRTRESKEIYDMKLLIAIYSKELFSVCHLLSHHFQYQETQNFCSFKRLFLPQISQWYQYRSSFDYHRALSRLLKDLVCGPFSTRILMFLFPFLILSTYRLRWVNR